MEIDHLLGLFVLHRSNRTENNSFDFVTFCSAGPKNGTWRFDQVKSMKEGNKSSPVHDYLIPVRLVVMREPHGANETVPFLVQPKLVMVDKLNRTVSTLGHGYQGQWYVACVLNSLHVSLV